MRIGSSRLGAGARGAWRARGASAFAARGTASGAAGDARLPLSGIRILEVGQLIAGPMAGALLGYFGAEVIKVERPGTGDALRQFRMVEEDTHTSLWWRSLARNKKCVSVDIKKPEGADLVRRLAQQSDVLIENFSPGFMEKHGLGPEIMPEHLIYARVSGFGQSTWQSMQEKRHHGKQSITVHVFEEHKKEAAGAHESPFAVKLAQNAAHHLS